MNTPDNIPVIDISALRNETSTSHQLTDIGKKINTACKQHGFFYISGHGVSVSLQQQLEQLSKEFFLLREAEKMKISMEKGGKTWRGYFPVGDELTSGKPDQKEGIYFGEELSNSHPKIKAGIPLHGKNLFPSYPEGLKKVVADYMAATTEVGHLVMKGIAISLELKPDHFRATITSDPFILFRIFHYPAQRKKEETWGVGEHTDYGLLTILKQDNVGGLQVKANGKWIEAPVIENTFICNIGDMLDCMTGGLYRSTPHRVRNISDKNRLSFPLFFDPDFDAEVKPILGIPSPISPSEKRWDNADVYNFEGKYGDYLVRKVSKVFPRLFSKV
ncbi:MAG: isopenicillin N synthase family oxygenase [Flavobacteriales bacterium]|nr:isopenicillin N synthase family oxygenase [Flavobacteriales bacterium]